MAPTNLDELRIMYAEKSQMILEATREVATDSYGFLQIFTKTKLSRAKLKLNEYYDWLTKYDEVYSKNLITVGTRADVTVKDLSLKMVDRSRELFISSLRGYENELSNVESSLNFQLTTSIALLAILFSVIGLVLPLFNI